MSDDDLRIRPDWKRIRHLTDRAGDARKSAEVVHMIASLIETPGSMLLAGRDAMRFIAKEKFGLDPGWFWEGDDDEDRDWYAEESLNWTDEDDEDEDEDNWYDDSDSDEDEDSWYGEWD